MACLLFALRGLQHINQAHQSMHNTAHTQVWEKHSNKWENRKGWVGLWKEGEHWRYDSILLSCCLFLYMSLHFTLLSGRATYCPMQRHIFPSSCPPWLPNLHVHVHSMLLAAKLQEHMNPRLLGSGLGKVLPKQNTYSTRKFSNYLIVLTLKWLIELSGRAQSVGQFHSVEFTYNSDCCPKHWYIWKWKVW